MPVPHFTEYDGFFSSTGTYVTFREDHECSQLTNSVVIWNTNLMRSLDDDEKRKLEEYVESTKVQKKTLEQGAATTLVAALDPSLASSNGAFLMDCAIAEPFCEDAKRVELDEQLWRLSETLVGETFAH